jgi:deoxyxylulose-5-phosphate synthase
MRALGIGDLVVEHGDPEQILADLELDAASIARAARALLAR